MRYHDWLIIYNPETEIHLTRWPPVTLKIDEGHSPNIVEMHQFANSVRDISDILGSRI